MGVQIPLLASYHGVSVYRLGPLVFTQLTRGSIPLNAIGVGRKSVFRISGMQAARMCIWPRFGWESLDARTIERFTAPNCFIVVCRKEGSLPYVKRRLRRSDTQRVTFRVFLRPLRGNLNSDVDSKMSTICYNNSVGRVPHL